jgi:RimJ/RimL family protein N-acetyltransferase
LRLISDPSLTPIIGNWVGERVTSTGEISFTGEYEAIGVFDESEIVAGFIFHEWNPTYKTISMSLAANSPKWGSRRNIEGILRYPFIELGVQRITVTINENNHASIRLAEGVGFKREAVIERGAGIYGNIIVLRLFVEEWQSGKYNREH